ncbi:unnamed protein product [Nippostrongylus brasiliensis]|uniref:ATP synthase subunit f, mitochondrial n=1 Tax=Nippostrongylus brasiliensis TaxID=27835 RepID=A0A0N4XP74_NIPBR|nr:unnamed protein product [Nippostrongylus brasiliensis]
MSVARPTLRTLYAVIDKTPAWAEFIKKPAVRPFVWLFGRLTVMYSMGFAFLCFGLVKTKYWIGVSFYRPPLQFHNFSVSLNLFAYQRCITLRILLLSSPSKLYALPVLEYIRK